MANKAEIKRVGLMLADEDGRMGFYLWEFGKCDDTALVYQGGELVTVAGWTPDELVKVFEDSLKEKG